MLVIKDSSGAVIAVRSGRDSADWAQDIRVVGDELSWTFKSDGSVNGWGFRFTVQPLMPKKLHGQMLLSDRVLQSRPSIDLVTCLLDFQLGRAPRQECIARLGASLASCAQLNTLDASQRMWAIQHLRKLINSVMSGHLVSGAMGTCCPLKQVHNIPFPHWCHQAAYSLVLSGAHSSPHPLLMHPSLSCSLLLHPPFPPPSSSSPFSLVVARLLPSAHLCEVFLKPCSNSTTMRLPTSQEAPSCCTAPSSRCHRMHICMSSTHRYYAVLP